MESKEVDRTLEPEVKIQTTSCEAGPTRDEINYELIDESPCAQTDSYLREEWV